jgi:integrase
MDDGGMSIRLDPRRLGALKLLAAEAGVRPGELVTSWVEERLDAARAGSPAPAPVDTDGLASLAARVEQLARRLDQMAAAPTVEPESAAPAPPAKRGPGRPRKAAPRTKTEPRVALHDEITAVIKELGPQTAAELASAIAARGRYQAPRTAKPLDAATVNARVSNPTYRGRFVRREHRIGLAVE